jgi:sec-independent protein translocase protein TatC
VPLDQPTAGGEMPFLDHLEELRWRIVKSVAALAITFGTTFTLVWLNFDAVFRFLIAPVQPLLPDGHLVYTHPIGIFTVIMQVAGVLGLVFASPVIGYQVWSFLSPALHERERRVIVPVMGFGVLLFLTGIALAVLVVIPMTVTMMKGISAELLVPMITADQYFSFLFWICLGFGVVFELPVVILILTALGLVTPHVLARYRRHALVTSLITCMMVIPGDAITATLAMWIPVYGLYELSIIVSWFVYRARLKREAQAESIGAGASA